MSSPLRKPIGCSSTLPKTDTGLAVSADLLDGDYPTGTKISQKQMAQLHLQFHHTCPMWNYTIRPQIQKCEVIS